MVMVTCKDSQCGNYKNLLNQGYGHGSIGVIAPGNKKIPRDNTIFIFMFLRFLPDFIYFVKQMPGMQTSLDLYQLIYPVC